MEAEEGLDGAWVIDVYREVVDDGCEAVDEDNALAGAATSPLVSWVTSSPSATTSISLVSCPLAPPTSALSLKFPGSLALPL